MPFDGSGNFTRSYNFQEDRNNGLKILAARVDGEFDNFAGGMNQVFFRSGLVPMSGNLNMGTNRILGLSSGAVGAPSLSFATDGTSGLYSEAAGDLSLSGGGQKSASFTAAGQTLLGKTVFAGDTQFYRQLTTGNPWDVYDVGDYLAFNRSTSQFEWRTGDALRASLGSTGLQVFNTLGVSNPASGFVNLVAGDTTHAGYISFSSPANVRQGYVGYTTVNGPIQYASDTGAGHTFSGGTLNSQGGLQVNGQNVWHTGNLNPGAYAPLSGAAFSGAISASSGTFSGNVLAASYLVDSQFYMQFLSGSPAIAWDASDYNYYDRGANKWYWVIGGTPRMSLDGAGDLRVAGNIYGSITP